MKDEILLSNPEFENDFNNLINNDDFRYFYHVTNKDGDDICNEGLYLVERRLDSTTIEIPNEFKNDPINYCLNEIGENYRKNPHIILLGIPKEDVDYVIKKNYNMPNNWTSDEFPEYIIYPNYVIGYIDTDTFEIHKNENFEFANEFYLN